MSKLLPSGYTVISTGKGGGIFPYSSPIPPPTPDGNFTLISETVATTDVATLSSGPISLDDDKIYLVCCLLDGSDSSLKNFYFDGDTTDTNYYRGRVLANANLNEDNSPAKVNNGTGANSAMVSFAHVTVCNGNAYTINISNGEDDLQTIHASCAFNNGITNIGEVEWKTASGTITTGSWLKVFQWD